mmetsp:Transcript_1920/g.2008  ORF Transcript_1920/g.2008 Transcript_1920/m.2008 type:complete len:92 (-) Transcript_1920:679-954(-)
MQHANILAIAGLRIDGRRNNELRDIKYKIGLNPSADGSTYFEQGLNKILVVVNGPQEPSRRSGDNTSALVLSINDSTSHKSKMPLKALRFV